MWGPSCVEIRIDFLVALGGSEGGSQRAARVHFLAEFSCKTKYNGIYFYSRLNRVRPPRQRLTGGRCRWQRKRHPRSTVFGFSKIRTRPGKGSRVPGCSPEERRAPSGGTWRTTRPLLLPQTPGKPGTSRPFARLSRSLTKWWKYAPPVSAEKPPCLTRK